MFVGQFYMFDMITRNTNTVAEALTYRTLSKPPDILSGDLVEGLTDYVECLAIKGSTMIVKCQNSSNARTLTGSNSGGLHPKREIRKILETTH
jgi:hypothetical protein